MDYKPHAIGSQEIILPSTSRTVEVNYYGDGGDPLVFLHGSGMHPQAYRTLFAAMVEENPNLQIVAPCGPGIGQSSPLLKGEPIADWPAQVMEETGVTDADELNVRISGHSRGGVEALHTAARFKELKVLTLASPIDKIPEDSIALLGNLMLDTAISNYYSLASAMFRFDIGAFTKVATKSLTTGVKFGMTTPETAHAYQEAITQLSKLPVAERRELFDSGRAQAVFGGRDPAVSQPQDSSWPGVHQTAGGHNFLIEDDIRRRAHYIHKLLYPGQF